MTFCRRLHDCWDRTLIRYLLADACLEAFFSAITLVDYKVQGSGWLTKLVVSMKDAQLILAKLM
jgi:hypothetical protein